MGSRWCWSAVLLGACAPCPPFGEVAIEGGSDGSRAVVAETLAAFADWTGRDGACVDTVRLLDDVEADGSLESLGGYRSFRRLIELKEAQPNLSDTLVHELCHAVDRVDDVSREHRDAFRYDPARADYDDRSEASRRREAMALTCEAGPVALAVARSVGEVCEPDLDLGAIDAVQREVYPVTPHRLPPVDVRRVDVGAWELPDDWTIDGPVVAGEGGEIVVGARVGGDSAWIAIEPWSGALVEVPERGIAPMPPPPPSTYLWEDVRSASWPDGQHVATFRWRLASGHTIRPLLVHDDASGWRLPEEPCGTATTWLVELDGDPWAVELDGRTLRWGVFER